MIAQRSMREMGWKLALALLLVVLAFQSLGMNGLAAPAASMPLLQSETPTPMPLTCGSSLTTPTYCDIQIVLMIDDSGSMRTNDPGGLRNQGAINLVNILADQYFSAAQTLKNNNESFRLPDVRVAVIHFSRGVKRNSGWIPIDPNNLEQWKSDLNTEINWPPRGTKEYTDFYARKQYTSFSESFEFAKRLLLSSDVQKAEDDCTRRSILLFTDGTPESERGILSGDELAQEMGKVQASTVALQDALVDGLKTKIYITAFKINSSYWNQVEDTWITIAGYAQTPVKDEILRQVVLVEGTSGSLDELPARMEAITASLIDVKRFAVNQSGTQSYQIDIPAHIESARFTLYNSDTAASLVITDPEKNVITVDSPGVSEVSGQGTPIQVWQLDRPVAGRYSVKAQDAKRPGIITWLLAYQGLTATFDNPPGSFEPGKEGNIQFSLADSAGSSVLADQDALDINVSITQFGEEETFVKPTLVDGKYNLLWTPKNSRPARFTVSLTSARVDLGLNCSLIFDLISTVTPTFTPTNTPTFTPTPTETPVPPTDITPIPMVAIFPQCVPPGEDITLPMRLDYGDTKGLPDALEWQAVSDNPNMEVSVHALDADSGKFELRMGPISKVAGPIQLQLKAVDSSGGQAATVFQVATSIGVCSLPPTTCDCNRSLWTLWLWPLVIVLAGLLILLLVLRFRTERNNEETSSIFRSRDWHLLFWPLLLLLVMLVLVRLMEWCCVIPPWLFLVSILIWVLLVLLLRFIPGRDLPQPRPWWLVILLLLLVFLGYLVISIQALFLLWLLLVLLVTLVIVWFVSPDVPPIPGFVERDDLKVLEGIEEGVEKLLNDEGKILTFRQLAMTDIKKLEVLLQSKPWGKMMDPKTWPQQAKLADIAKRYRLEDDRQNFEAYKAWLKNGIEPDEYEQDEKNRRTGAALLWNGIPQFTPLVLSLAISPSSVYQKQAIVLPMQLNRESDRVRLAAVKWQVSASSLPGGKDVKASVKTVSAELGTYELVVGPVQDRDASEIQVSMQALVNGRSIEIFYGKAIGLRVSPPSVADDLKELEGIEQAVEKILNEQGIHTFEQLARTDHQIINEWLNAAGLKMMDAKTWPQQAKLADVAKKYSREEDQRSYNAYKNWLKGGIEPDEYKVDEKDRRSVALVWYGSAELTEKAYAEIFKQK